VGSGSPGNHNYPLKITEKVGLRTFMLQQPKRNEIKAFDSLMRMKSMPETAPEK